MKSVVTASICLNTVPPSEPYFEVASDEAWVAGRRYTVVCVAPDAKPEAQIQLYKGEP